MVEEHPQPPQARAAPAVAQHLGALTRIGGVDAHVEGAESLGDDPLEVGLGEAGQRREVAVQERQAVVVVLEVEAAAHPRRQLVDETELAMVVAGLDPVEQRAVDLDAQRRTGGLVDLDVVTQPATVDFEQQRRLVDQQLILDDVAGNLLVDGEDAVTGRDPGPLCWRIGDDGDHHGGGHGAKATDGPSDDGPRRAGNRRCAGPTAPHDAGR